MFPLSDNRSNANIVQCEVILTTKLLTIREKTEQIVFK